MNYIKLIILAVLYLIINYISCIIFIITYFSCIIFTINYISCIIFTINYISCIIFTINYISCIIFILNDISYIKAINYIRVNVVRIWKMLFRMFRNFYFNNRKLQHNEWTLEMVYSDAFF